MKLPVFIFIFLKRKLCSAIKNRNVLPNMKHLIYFLSATILLTSCWKWRPTPEPEPLPPLPPPIKVLGYVPVYSTDPAAYAITADTPRAMKYPGKIYVKDNLIFQNDQGFGIHVFDKTIPSSPKNIGFIKLKGNQEMSIKGNYLYANSYADLVVVDITDWLHVKEVQRIKGAFYQGNSAYAKNPYLFVPPPERSVYYQCIDDNKGVVIGWKPDSIYNNTCYYY